MAREHSYLVWIDLEMTGLNAHKDVILEAAVIVTTNELELVDEGLSYIIHYDTSIHSLMIPKIYEMHTKSGLLDRVQTATHTIDQVQEAIVAYIKKWCKPHSSPLCGNTVWQDRLFIRKYMPLVDEYLHYRIVDVSSIKELINRWYPTSPYRDFFKKKAHRALEDIHESIAELRHYKNHFFV